MEILGELFGSEARVRMLRLFMFNPHMAFDPETIAERIQGTTRQVNKELQSFRAIGLIKDRAVIRVKKAKAGKRETRKKVRGWIYDEAFPYGKELASLLTNTVPLKNGRMVEKINQIGKIKLLVVAGLFTQDPDSRVDLFIVGDQLKRKTFERVIKDIEADVGAELRYALFDTDDFKYRLSVYDKLIKDVFDFPHHTIVDKLGIHQ
jgi:hypothetical protein